MAQRLEIQYIRFDTDGSAARQPAPVSRQKQVSKPRPRRQKQPVLYIDPVAILGVAVAAVMLVAMLVSLVQFYQAQQELQTMQSYVQELFQENQQLQEMYDSGYDLEEVLRVAEALGMVPRDQVESILLQMPAPEAPPQPTFWEKISTFLSGLFA